MSGLSYREKPKLLQRYILFHTKTHANYWVLRKSVSIQVIRQWCAMLARPPRENFHGVRWRFFSGRIYKIRLNSLIWIDCRCWCRRFVSIF